MKKMSVGLDALRYVARSSLEVMACGGAHVPNEGDCARGGAPNGVWQVANGTVWSGSRLTQAHTIHPGGKESGAEVGEHRRC